MVRIVSFGMVLLFGLILTFQNCGRYSSLKQATDLSSYAGTSFCTANPTNSACTTVATPKCSFNGQTVAEGAAVQAFLTSTVASGSTCQAETRKCQSGVLSGSYTYANCAVAAAASCLFNGTTIASGATITGYVKSVVDAGASCNPQTRTCTNGVLSGQGDYASCVNSDYKSCLFNGQTIAHGGSIAAFDVSSVPFGNTCQASTRTCYNGALSGHGDYGSCVVAAPVSCLFNGQTIPHGGTVVGFASSSVPYGSQCSSTVRTCNNGTLSGTGDYGSCAVAAGASCLVNGQTIPSGGAINLYFSASDTTCASETRVCTNGSLSGSATYGSCQYPVGAVNVFFDFGTLAAQNGGCSSTDLHSAACASAFSRACGASGYATGYGPLEITGTSAQATCVGPAMVAQSSVSWGTLQAYQPSCSKANSTSTTCLSAVHRYCANNGYSNGLGITEVSDSNANIYCLNGAGSTNYTATWGELYVSHHGCYSNNGDLRNCSTAVNRYCQSLGSGFSSGFGIQEYQLLNTSIVCLSPQAIAKTPEAMDTLSYFAPDQSNLKSGDMSLSEIVDPSTNSVYMLKYNTPSFYEKYVWDASNIYFAADDTDNHDLRFYWFRTPSQSRTTWMPRSFLVGATNENDDNLLSRFQFNTSTQTCSSVTTDQSFPFSIQLRQHIRNYNTKGSLGVVDVMVISYTYQSNPTSTPPTYGQERFFFARTLPDANGNTRALGWIRWENYGNMGSNDYPEGDPTAISPKEAVDFSSLSSDTPLQPLSQYTCGH